MHQYCQTRRKGASINFSMKQNPTKCHTSFFLQNWKFQFFLWTNIHNFRKKSKMDAPSPQKHRTKPLPNSPDHLRAQKRGAKPHLSVNWLLWHLLRFVLKITTQYFHCYTAISRLELNFGELGRGFRWLSTFSFLSLILTQCWGFFR